MVDELSVRISVALANCLPYEKEFLQHCRRDFEFHGKLELSQLRTMNSIYYRIYRELVRQGICKKNRFFS